MYRSKESDLDSFESAERFLKKDSEEIEKKTTAFALLDKYSLSAVCLPEQPDSAKTKQTICETPQKSLLVM